MFQLGYLYEFLYTKKKERREDINETMRLGYYIQAFVYSSQAERALITQYIWKNEEGERRKAEI
jgi:hypothetical protein